MNIPLTEDEIQELILYRDDLVIVLNKPSGMPAHPGRGMAIPLTTYFPQLMFDLPHEPRLAHRLDKDTSGCLILGRHPHALRILGKLFERGRINKTYWAVVEGEVPNEEGVMDFPLARQSEKSYLWRMKVDDQGQPSVTEYKVLGRTAGYTWLELLPKTGRTHQLRVHCAALGYPIVSDKAYGNGGLEGSLLHLHAQSIEIPLYPRQSPIIVTAPPPQHMQELLGKVEG